MKLGIGVIAILVGSATLVWGALPPVQDFTLDNGLRVVLAPDPEAQAVDVAAWFAAGTRVEPAGRSGISHLVERLMVRGDDLRPLAAQGAEVNSYSTPDFTSVFVTGAEPVVPAALDFLLARMKRLDVSSAALDQERAFVERERRVLVEGNPVRHGVEMLYAIAFPHHGYGRPAVGLAADVARLTVDDLTAYHRDHFGPPSTVLTVVGNFDPATVRSAIESRFAALPRRGAAAHGTAPGTPIAHASDRLAGAPTLVALGWPTVPAADSATVALELLARALGSEAGGRLARQPGRTAPYVQVRAAFDPEADGSLFYLLAVLRSPQDSTSAEIALTSQVEALANQPLAADELERVKREWEVDWLGEQQTARGRAQTLGTELLDRDGTDLERRWLERVRRVTAVELSDVARRALVSRRHSLAVLIPAAGARAPSATAPVTPKRAPVRAGATSKRPAASRRTK